MTRIVQTVDAPTPVGSLSADSDYSLSLDIDVVFTSDEVLHAVWWASFCMTWFFIGITHAHVPWKAPE